MTARLLREPLLHFLLLGAGLFLLYDWVAPAGSGDWEVVITRGRIDQLSAGFALMHQREPEEQELQGLIAEAVREEILYREALALGLDQDDTIIRRRLRQKLEFVSEDVAPIAEPSQAQLQAHLEANADKYRLEPGYTFTHVFIDPLRHGSHAQAEVARLRAELDEAGPGADATALGDPFLLARRFDGIAANELTGLFGARFTLALDALAPGQWSDPVPSGYGMHLVRLDKRKPGRQATLAEVHEQVLADWRQEQRRVANEDFYARIRARYDVVVQGDQPAAAPAAAVATLP